MDIKYKQTNHERYCAICNKLMNKGDIIVKYKEVIDDWGNSRVCDMHIDCLISCLDDYKILLEDKKNKLPDDIFMIERSEKNDNGYRDGYYLKAEKMKAEKRKKKK